MLHVLIDTAIYRADRRRNKAPFRAVGRLARAGSIKIHIPAFLKGEVLSQRQRDVREDIDKMKAAAESILRATNENNLRRRAENIVKIATMMESKSDNWIATELQSWIAEAQAIEHPIHKDHGARVARAYFAGRAPFRRAKYREDLPDSFIWEAALDLVKKHGELTLVSADGRLHAAADQHHRMKAYKSLDGFIESDECQDALADLTPAVVAGNVERIKKLLPDSQEHLIRKLKARVTEELAGKIVTHPAIRDDNNEATIISVGDAENVNFAFDDNDNYGDAEIGIPFTADVACELNYAIYKGDYYGLPDPEDISIDERNDQYFDADQTFTISIEGYLTLMFDETLEKDELPDKVLKQLINKAVSGIEITNEKVNVPYW